MAGEAWSLFGYGVYRRSLIDVGSGEDEDMSYEYEGGFCKN